MKHVKSGPELIDEYIARFPAEVRQRLNELRAVIREAAPDAEEKISYAMPTFYLNGNLVHFAAYENHIGFYPTPHGIEPFMDELSEYSMGKGSIQFPHEKPMPYELIGRMVKARVIENMQKPRNRYGK